MKIEIWCKEQCPVDFRDTDGRRAFTQRIPPLHVCTVEWPTLPRISDWLEVFDGWCGMEVLEVWHKLDVGLIRVYIAADDTGEILTEVERRRDLAPPL